MLTEDDIKNALKAVKYPGYSRDIVSFGLVQEVAAKNGAVSINMQLIGGSGEIAQQIKTESERVLKALPGVEMVYVAMFDEVDEATAIFKVSNSPPTQARFETYDGLPSDWYLRLTGEGSKVIRGERKNQQIIPIKP